MKGTGQLAGSPDFKRKKKTFFFFWGSKYRGRARSVPEKKVFFFSSVLFPCRKRGKGGQLDAGTREERKTLFFFRGAGRGEIATLYSPLLTSEIHSSTMAENVDKILPFSEDEAKEKGWLPWAELPPEAQDLYATPQARSSMPRNLILNYGWYDKEGGFCGLNPRNLVVTSVDRGSTKGFPYLSEKHQGPKYAFAGPAIRANPGYGQSRVGLFVPHAQGEKYAVMDADNNPVSVMDTDGEQAALQLPCIGDLGFEMNLPGKPVFKKGNPSQASYRMSVSDRDIADGFQPQVVGEGLTTSRCSRTMFLILLGFDFMITQWKVKNASDLNKGTRVRERLAQVADMFRPRSEEDNKEWDDLEQDEKVEFLLQALDKDRVNYFRATGKTLVWNPSIQIRQAKVYVDGKYENSKEKFANGYFFADMTAPVWNFTNDRKKMRTPVPEESETGINPATLRSVEEAIGRSFNNIRVYDAKDPGKVLQAEERALIEQGRSFLFPAFYLDPKTGEDGTCRCKLRLKALQLFYHGQAEGGSTSGTLEPSYLFNSNMMGQNLLAAPETSASDSLIEGESPKKKRKTEQ